MGVWSMAVVYSSCMSTESLSNRHIHVRTVDRNSLMYMEIHVHSTLAMKEVGRKRKATQTNKTYNTQTRQTGYTGHRFHQPYKNRTNQLTQI